MTVAELLALTDAELERRFEGDENCQTLRLKITLGPLQTVQVVDYYHQNTTDKKRQLPAGKATKIVSLSLTIH